MSYAKAFRSFVCRPLLLVLLLSSCASSATLTLEPSLPADKTVPTRAGRRFSSLMLLSSNRSVRGDTAELGEVERALIKDGIRVISPAVLGRIVSDSTGNRVETGKELSDLERLLVLAKDSNAEGLLQVTELGWETGRRRFKRSDDKYWPVTASYPDRPELLYMTTALFSLRARLIDVTNGEIIMNIDLEQDTASVVRDTVTVRVDPLVPIPSPLSGDNPGYRKIVVSQVMYALLNRLK